MNKLCILCRRQPAAKFSEICDECAPKMVMKHGMYALDEYGELHCLRCGRNIDGCRLYHGGDHLCIDCQNEFPTNPCRICGRQIVVGDGTGACGLCEEEPKTTVSMRNLVIFDFISRFLSGGF